MAGRLENLISKLNFYNLISYLTDQCYWSCASRSAQRRKRRSQSPPVGLAMPSPLTSCTRQLAMTLPPLFQYKTSPTEGPQAGRKPGTAGWDSLVF